MKVAATTYTSSGSSEDLIADFPSDNSSTADRTNQLVNEEPGFLGSAYQATAEGVKRILGTFMQSGDPAHIKWKVRKYEAQLVQLRQKFSEEFQAILEKDATEDDQQMIKDLYDILSDEQIKPEDPDRFTQTYLDQMRKLHNKAFIPKLRDCLENIPDSLLLLRVCVILHSELVLDQEIGETLELFDSLGASHEATKEEGEGSPITRRIKELYDRIASVPYYAKAPLPHQWGNSARGQWNRDFDPGVQGNPRHLMYQLIINERPVKALAMGSPTIEDSSSEASLSPEFVGFGRCYKINGLKHLFVLNQNSIPKLGVVSYVINGDETGRCNIILDSQEREDLKDAIYVIALSKNSPFYYQEGEYKAKDKADEFKGELWNQVFEMPREKSGCYIPQSIREGIDGFDDFVKNKMIEHIHNDLFDGKESLTVGERKVFIEQFYDQLLKYILSKMKFDSYNISCKDAIDRAAGSNAQAVANSAIVADPEGKITPEFQKMIEQLLMVRALLVRKRPPLIERVERFVEGLEFTVDNADKLKGLHQHLFDKLRIIPVRA